MLEKLRMPLLVILAILLAASVVAIPLSIHNPQYLKLSPFFLIAITILVAIYHKGDAKKALAVFAAIAVMGWIVDVFGVKTGVIFGEFQYGETLGVQLLNVPILIGLQWALLAYLGYIIAQPLEDPTRRTVAGAGTMALFDLIMEPAASRLGFWEFHNNHVPFQNYIFWFVFSYLFLRLVRKSKVQFTNSIAAPVYWMLLFFFVILDFTLLIIKP